MKEANPRNICSAAGIETDCDVRFWCKLKKVWWSRCTKPTEFLTMSVSKTAWSRLSTSLNSTECEQTGHFTDSHHVYSSTKVWHYQCDCSSSWTMQHHIGQQYFRRSGSYVSCASVINGLSHQHMTMDLPLTQPGCSCWTSLLPTAWVGRRLDSIMRTSWPPHPTSKLNSTTCILLIPIPKASLHTCFLPLHHPRQVACVIHTLTC